MNAAHQLIEQRCLCNFRTKPTNFEDYEKEAKTQRSESKQLCDH